MNLYVLVAFSKWLCYYFYMVRNDRQKKYRTLISPAMFEKKEVFMRYIIDTLDLSPELKKKYEKSEFSYKKYVRSYTFAFVCKECSAEIYGEYKYEDAAATCSVAISQELVRLRRALNNTSDAKEQRSIKRTIAQYEKARKLTGESIERAKSGYFAALSKENVCPVCGGKLHQEKGYFYPDINLLREEYYGVSYEKEKKQVEDRYGFYFSLLMSHSLDAIFEHLQEIRKIVNHKDSNALLEAYTQKCNIIGSSSAYKASEVKKNRDLLNTYILNLIRLENNIYSLEQQLRDLYYRRIVNKCAVVFETHSAAYHLKTELERRHDTYQSALKTIEDAKTCQPVVSVDYPDEPPMPVLEKPGLFNKKKVAANNEALMKQYHADMAEYQQEVLRCDAEKERLIAVTRDVAIENAKKNASAAKADFEHMELEYGIKIKELQAGPVPAKAAKMLLDQEIETAENLLMKTYAARNELYSYEIVFGKYRNSVALSSFYEYLISGRCTALEGADGAYNIFEREIRENRIIAQLDTVISSLDDIKANQYMIYQEMQTMNSLLTNMSSTMDKALTSIRGIEANTTQMNEYMERVAENTDVIAHNTAVSAYYSKVNAELTNALGYLVALK